MPIPGFQKVNKSFQAKRTIAQMNIDQQRVVLDNLEEGIAALEEILDKIETVEFRWLVERFLPSERRRISEERNSINPQDSIKQAICTGQINEISHLTDLLEDVKSSLQRQKIRRSEIFKALKKTEKRKT